MIRTGREYIREHIRPTCRHENADHLMPGDRFALDQAHAAPYRVTCEQFRCIDCGEWLSLGPAVHTLNVLVEIRAAEIAAEYGDMITHAWLMCEVSDAERDGWEGDHDGILTMSEDAGWLAREIATHPDDSASKEGR